MIDNAMGALFDGGLSEGVRFEANELPSQSESFDFIETDYREYT